MNAERTSLFSDAPVQKAVLTLAIPTVISQLITVVYNMADTFFIGKLNDPLQVAAATIAMPCFMLLTGLRQPLWPGRLQSHFPLPRHERSGESAALRVVLHLDGRGGRAARRNCRCPARVGAVSDFGCQCGHLGVLPSICLLDDRRRRCADL